nr:divalent metal cation transporter [Planctomycetota bacterium]
VKIFENVLKIMVGLIVVAFFLVVGVLTFSGALSWGEVFNGALPRVSDLFRPAHDYAGPIAATAHPEAWTRLIVDSQRDIIITAFGTAVGINMTFLLPYSMLGRGWGREHRGLAIFDLSTGMFIPFFLATTCVVVAAAARFHAVPQPGLIAEATDGESATVRQQEEYEGLLKSRPAAATPVASDSERQLAAMLVTRDAQALAGSLDKLLGRQVAHVVFGLGVLGMALSTITLLMLVAGFVTCEVLNVPPTGWPLRFGSLFAATGVLGPFVFTGAAAFWLAVPMSVLALTLLPIAYLTFLLMMNSERLLGGSRPRGGKRLAVNVVLGLSTAVAFFASGWAIVAKVGYGGLTAIVAAFFVMLLIGESVRRRALT